MHVHNHVVLKSIESSVKRTVRVYSAFVTKLSTFLDLSETLHNSRQNFCRLSMWSCTKSSVQFQIDTLVRTSTFKIILQNSSFYLLHRLFSFA